MRFKDRDEAARMLAEGLLKYRGHHPLVLGIPRGGVPMAAIIADRLGCDFDVVLAGDPPPPSGPHVARGAVAEAARVHEFGAPRPVRPAAGQTAIIVDDGMATGESIVAAVRSIRAQRPLRIVVATPVAARPALDLARSFADEVICLHNPKAFLAVGDFYHDFSPVADSTVVELLRPRAPPSISPADTRSALPQTRARRPTL